MGTLSVRFLAVVELRPLLPGAKSRVFVRMETKCLVCMCWVRLRRMSRNRRFRFHCCSCATLATRITGKHYASFILWYCSRFQSDMSDSDPLQERNAWWPKAESGHGADYALKPGELRRRVAIERRHDQNVIVGNKS